MQISLIASVFMLGLFGSWHCGVMCGSFSCNFRKKEQFITYQVGRLVSYLILGTILFNSTHFFLDAESHKIKAISSFIFGLIFIVFGLSQLNLFKNKNFIFKYYKIQFKLFEKFNLVIKKIPLLMGFLTGLLPCSWLYSFLFLATQMKSINEALFVIFIFWLSALPAFIMLTGFMRKLINSSPLSYQRISAGILIAAGLFSIFGHWVEIIFL